MDISFTSITNLKLLKSKTPKVSYGLYPSITGEVKNGEKVANEYKMLVDLTGSDYDSFLSAMTIAEKGLNTSYFKNAPNRIELLLTKYDIPEDDIIHTSFNVFRINNENVSLTQRKGLKLYEYLAHMTKNILKTFNLSEDQKECIKIINDSIHNDAVEFIENM